MTMHPMPRSRESERRTASGYTWIVVGLALLAASLLFFVTLQATGPRGLVVAVPLLLLSIFVFAGLYMLQPNEAAILLLFGAYRGTDRREGLRWANPFFRKLKISLRARNLATEKLKVNDKRGNPIEIAAAVVWRVRDTAQASFDVDDYEQYVRIQAEAAVRHLASSYAYDDGEDLAPGELTLRAGQDRIAQSLVRELTDRFEAAGIVVEDGKLTHLAYAPEIAQVMLRRQQAEAIVSARSRIVQGAVGMVEMALRGLSERNLVQLDDERRAAMVSNLLVVLCGESEATPVINTGTLYA
jgi:hypothetical protein